jgi:hypothetical protein
MVVTVGVEREDVPRPLTRRSSRAVDLCPTFLPIAICTHSTMFPIPVNWQNYQT